VQIARGRRPATQPFFDGLTIDSKRASRLTVCHLRDESVQNGTIEKRLTLPVIQAKRLLRKPAEAGPAGEALDSPAITGSGVGTRLTPKKWVTAHP
jgi:hypothetical protein